MGIENIEKYIDHTNLKADAKEEDIKKLCKEAKDYGFAAVCINPCYVGLAKDELKGSDCKVCTVIGFPLGANEGAVKVFEAKKAVEDGAEEVDMVINIGRLKSGDMNFVRDDIKAVVEEVKGRACVKVIIEACLLSEEEKVMACEMAMKAGADYVKTSTGFSIHGARVEDVSLMKKTVASCGKVKAAGGIRDLETAIKMIEAGADRIGTSVGVEIMKGL